jgi:hypothetical protein
MSSPKVEDQPSQGKKSNEVTSAVVIAEALDDATATQTPKHSNIADQGQKEQVEKDLEKDVESSQNSPPVTFEVPDGGRDAWLTVFGAYVP